jgi:hypothetical protein
MPKTNLQTRSARLELAPRPKPYGWTIERGLTLGYRRRDGAAGSWIAIGSNGQGGQWAERFATADDMADADGVNVWSFAQARDKAVTIARARGNDVAVTQAPTTIGEAFAAFKKDLTRRGGNPENVTTALHHFRNHPALLAVPLARVTVKQLKTWNEALIDGGMKDSTRKRLLKTVHAAFNCAANADDAIAANRSAWKRGLEVPRNAERARNVLLATAEVLAIVRAAYGINAEFGLLVQAHAELGSRSDQIGRITVGDLKGNRLMVPNSGKGRHAVAKRNDKTTLAIGDEFARRLAAAAGNRPASAPLLTRPDGQQWGDLDTARDWFDRAVRLAGIEQGERDAITLVALRHTSIARALENGAPAKDVADWHNTSIRMIETNYARHMVNTLAERMGKHLISTMPAVALAA